MPSTSKSSELKITRKLKRPAPKPSASRIGSGNSSAFLGWFEQQAGKPRLNEADYIKLKHDTVPSLRAALASAERELAEANRYRTGKQYALYAWYARDTLPNAEADLDKRLKRATKKLRTKPSPFMRAKIWEAVEAVEAKHGK